MEKIIFLSNRGGAILVKTTPRGELEDKDKLRDFYFSPNLQNIV